MASSVPGAERGWRWWLTRARGGNTADLQDVDTAVAAAKKAGPAWRKLTIKSRAKIMFRFQSLMETHKDRLARLIVKENGKNITEALAEVAKGNETVEWATSLPQQAQVCCVRADHAGANVRSWCSPQPCECDAVLSGPLSASEPRCHLRRRARAAGHCVLHLPLQLPYHGAHVDRAHCSDHGQLVSRCRAAGAPHSLRRLSAAARADTACPVPAPTA